MKPDKQMKNLALYLSVFLVVVFLTQACSGATPTPIEEFPVEPAVQREGILRVGTSGDYPPFSHLLPAAPPSYEGFDVAMARAYTQERGLALELVEFRWPQLVEDLRAGRFDVVMSGVTMRPQRSVAGRFSVPVAESGAVVLLRNPEHFSTLEELDQRVVRIGVNAGGHLERVARAHFSKATLVFIPENAAVRDALLSYSVEAAVTDTLEAPLWQSLDPDCSSHAR